ncbi:MAG: CPBP family glutamic-type intramembrane protease [Candidatus Thermoplasmatota archaeon]
MAAAKPRKTPKAPMGAAKRATKAKSPAKNAPRPPANPVKTAAKPIAKPTAPRKATAQWTAAPAAPAAAWTPVVAPPAALQAHAFDPATGAWLPAPVPPPASSSADAPDAARKGVGYLLWSILLGFDLALLGISILAAIAFGIVLVFAPDSSSADWVRSQLEGGTSADLVVNTLAAFVSFGVIPLLWVLGTRRVPLEGAKRFLHLHEPAKGILRGVLLTIPLLVGVVILSVGYTVATEGVDGLTNPEEDVNPALQDILDNLTWPLAALVALCAGIGEEIFFRGLMQRWVGPWGQAVLFGLAHATGGYIPQIVFALGLGILFGHLVKRGWSLWTMITAHVLYDFTLLATALLFPETV